MTKNERKLIRLEAKLNLYQIALLGIANQICQHEDVKGVGVVNNPRCPQCVAYCALYPEKTQPRVEAAIKMKECDTVMRDLKGLNK